MDEELEPIGEELEPGYAVIDEEAAGDEELCGNAEDDIEREDDILDAGV